MIIQTAIYWLYRALISLLAQSISEEKPNLRRLELLAKKQLHLVEKGLGIAESINSFANRLEKKASDGEEDYQGLAPSFRNYALNLYNLFTLLKEFDNRIIVLASAPDDPDLQGKLSVLYHDMANYVYDMFDEDWVSPVSCMVAVSKKCHIITCAEPEQWDLYPNYAWGCFNILDKCWAEDAIEYSAEGEACTYVHPVQFVPKMNMPNYFYWACVYYVAQDSKEQADMVQEIERSVVAVASEEDKDSTEENSSVPSMQTWGRIKKYLPTGTMLSVVPTRTRETVWDVMAGKEQVYNVQTMLMQLVGEQE